MKILKLTRRMSGFAYTVEVIGMCSIVVAVMMTLAAGGVLSLKWPVERLIESPFVALGIIQHHGSGGYHGSGGCQANQWCVTAVK